MPINHQYNYIFVHIPKVAGTSIQEALGACDFVGKIGFCDKIRYKLKAQWWHHLPLLEIKRLIAEDQFQQYFKFAFVRNPYDLFVSHYCYWFHKYFKTFEQWILSIPAEIYQLDLICNDKGDIIADFVGRYENLNEDWEKVCTKIGLQKKLSIINKSAHSHYSNYYNDKTRRIVERLQQREIEKFGYIFENK